MTGRHYHQVLYGFREVAHQYGPNISLQWFPTFIFSKGDRSNVNNTHRMLLKSKKTEMNDVSCSNCRVIFLLWRYTTSSGCCTRPTRHTGAKHSCCSVMSAWSHGESSVYTQLMPDIYWYHAGQTVQRVPIIVRVQEKTVACKFVKLKTWPSQLLVFCSSWPKKVIKKKKTVI